MLAFDFWTILVHGRFDDSSHFALMDTHYVWAACAQNRIASLKIYTSYLIDGQVLFRIVTLYAFYNVFECIDGVRVFSNQGPRFERNYFIAFMSITRLICIQ